MEILTATREWGFFHLTWEMKILLMLQTGFLKRKKLLSVQVLIVRRSCETLGTKMQGAVRISVSHKNTEEEIDRTANAIKKLSQLLE